MLGDIVINVIQKVVTIYTTMTLMATSPNLSLMSIYVMQTVVTMYKAMT
jgi:hypothetical protein